MGVRTKRMQRAVNLAMYHGGVSAMQGECGCGAEVSTFGWMKDLGIARDKVYLNTTQGIKTSPGEIQPHLWHVPIYVLYAILAGLALSIAAVSCRGNKAQEQAMEQALKDAAEAEIKRRSDWKKTYWDCFNSGRDSSECRKEADEKHGGGVEPFGRDHRVA